MILGAVLAGGQAKRFGSDKALARWRGKALIEHVIRGLATVSSKVIVCGRRVEGEVSIADRPGPRLGPLGGLNAALHFAVVHGFPLVVSAPCDTPDLDQRLLASLVAGRGNAYLANLPVIGCWRSSDAAGLEEHLRTGGSRAMRRWAELIQAVPLDLPVPANINRPADLEQLDSI